jgi:hypothetical protein
MSNKAIVLDANILIRAVLGQRVRELSNSTKHRERELDVNQISPGHAYIRRYGLINEQVAHSC